MGASVDADTLRVWGSRQMPQRQDIVASSGIWVVRDESPGGLDRPLAAGLARVNRSCVPVLTAGRKLFGGSCILTKAQSPPHDGAAGKAASADAATPKPTPRRRCPQGRAVCPSECADHESGQYQ